MPVLRLGQAAEKLCLVNVESWHDFRAFAQLHHLPEGGYENSPGWSQPQADAIRGYDSNRIHSPRNQPPH
jgi:hypothetical protein